MCLRGHQLPESPPDSGSENPYSPETQVSHTIAVSQTVLGTDYMLVPEHMTSHEILQQNGDYIYEELKSDSIDHEVLRNNLNDVVVLPADQNLDLGIRSVRHDLGLTEPIAYNRYGQMRVELPELEQGILNPQLVSLGHENLTPVYTNLQEPSAKKRKHSQDVNSQVKCEPGKASSFYCHRRLVLQSTSFRGRSFYYELCYFSVNCYLRSIFSSKCIRCMWQMNLVKKNYSNNGIVV